MFGIIGSANSHIFDSINKLGFTEIVNVHHEQAATMAMQAYYRIKKEPCACIVTAGAGSSNSITELYLPGQTLSLVLLFLIKKNQVQ